MKAITLHLGLDVHTDSITLALAEDRPHSEIPALATSGRGVTSIRFWTAPNAKSESELDSWFPPCTGRW
jgi:hypothetical protein